MVVKKLLVISLCFLEGFSVKLCGIAASASGKVYEGKSNIETYPWLGFLYYQFNLELYTTAVVLVSRQIVLATAAEIDALPKTQFRSHARVVLGHTCSNNSIGIREYTYHPDYFKSSTITTICVIQLETDAKIESVLRPICAPPTHFSQPIFYAMVPSNSCLKSTVMIYKMVFVPLEQCKMYYRRNGLDVKSFWPAETVCAKSMTDGKCVWRSGAILTVKAGNRWRLLGFGVYGPGCRAPARFLDYGLYQKWVRRSVARIGRPSITILDSNHLIMRRMSSNVQRFGTCDFEETLFELYTDHLTLTRGAGPLPYAAGVFKYNISLFENVEYSCIILKAINNADKYKTKPKPFIRLRKWCAGDKVFCGGYGLLSIHLYVEITFVDKITFDVQIYGIETKTIDIGQVIIHMNKVKGPCVIYNMTNLQKIMKQKSYRISNWFTPSYSRGLRIGPNIVSKAPGKMLDRTLHIKRPVNRHRNPITNRIPNDWTPTITTKTHLNWEKEPKAVTETNKLGSHKTIFDTNWDADTPIYEQHSDSSSQGIVTEKPVQTATRPYISIKRPLVTLKRPIATIERPVTKSMKTTARRLDITEGPFITTKIPRRTTKTSVITKEGSVITFAEPVRTTERSIVINHRHIMNTKRPVRPTKRPIRTIKRPIRTTKRPIRTTKRHVRTTKRFIRTRTRTFITTKKPVRITKKPVIFTERPVRNTNIPNVRTNEEPIINTESDFVIEIPFVTPGRPARIIEKRASASDYSPEYSI